MISMDKQYRTKNGYEVRIYAVDGSGYYPIHGAYMHNGEWVMYRWNEQGISINNPELNLIEVKPRIQREEWVNVYSYGSCGYLTRKDADVGASPDRISCIKRTLDCEEGEGL